MIRFLIYISLIIIALSGCKKVDIEPPAPNSPVFSVEAVLNNDTLNWGAGDDDFYMFTEFSIDSLDIYTLTGRLAKDTGCVSDCEEYLSFSLRSSYPTSSVNQFDIEQALSATNPSYFQEAPSVMNGFRYTFFGTVEDTLGGSSASNFLWEIAGDTSIGPTIFYDDFSNQDIPVKMTAAVDGACAVVLDRTIPVGSSSATDSCLMEVDIITDSLSGNVFLNISIPQSAGGTDFFWQNNLISSPDSFFLALAAGGPTASFLLSGTDAFGCATDMNLCVSGSPNQIASVAIPKFSYTSEPLTITTFDEQFSAVKIDYSDGNQLYSTKFGNNDNSTFTILDMEEFEVNENGEKTKKLTVNYNATLFNATSTDALQISGTGVIAVAYPN
ncbi:MAG: hypothetical protein AAF573_01525 [Bacteroidota bacterium]